MEDRVFLFIDLVASTEITERIGDIAYHRLLNRFLFDLSRAQVASRGEIYKYLGDGVIVTWPHARGVANANCLRCLQRLDAQIARSCGAYEAEFGTVPGYRAGLHAGQVVAGELGDFKQEIGFLGDAINTAARIEEACRALGRRVLISAPLAAELDAVLPSGITLEPVGPVELRGKSGDLSLCAVEIASQP
jgi:class 3 adenylate cyclase